MDGSDGWRISVVFERRSDGGLRVYSDDVPGFVLSHPDAVAVLADVEPALRVIMSERLGVPVTVRSLGRREGAWFPDGRRQTTDYEARRAAA